MSGLWYRILLYKLKEGTHQMNTLERIQKEQAERRLAQQAKDKAIVEAMFSNNARPLNNSYLLMKEEN